MHIRIILDRFTITVIHLRRLPLETDTGGGVIKKVADEKTSDPSNLGSKYLSIWRPQPSKNCTPRCSNKSHSVFRSIDNTDMVAENISDYSQTQCDHRTARIVSNNTPLCLDVSGKPM